MDKINAQIWLPKKRALDKLPQKITHMAIGAHCDDLEIIGLDGIVKHFKKRGNNFFGVIVSNSQGGPIHPKFKHYSPSKIEKIREEEQIKAAQIGKYKGVAFLRYPSVKIKDPKSSPEIEEKIRELAEYLNPQIIYTHSLFDKHPTHIAVSLRTIEALRNSAVKPEKLYGVSVWGSLNWLSQDKQVVFNLSSYEKLILKLLRVFKSQRFGPHKHDQALLSKMRADAIYLKTHEFTKHTSLIKAVDLSPLIHKNLSLDDYLKSYISDLERTLFERINKLK
jgi:LmbE family N-acetylglucosaminyl deacetylase